MKAIPAGLAILLAVRAAFLVIRRYPYNIQTANGVASSHDSLIDLLESIEHFLNRFDVYTRIPYFLNGRDSGQDNCGTTLHARPGD